MNKRMVFWLKFYLINDHNFQSDFPQDYQVLLTEFKNDPRFIGSIQLDLDKFLTPDAPLKLSNALDRIVKQESFVTNAIVAKAFASELVQHCDRKMLGRIISDNLCPESEIRSGFLFLRDSSLKNSFYDVSFVELQQLEGNWLSTRETDQIRINYNMIELTPVGSQLRLQIKTFDASLHSFECFAKAHDYKNDQVGEIKVFETRIKVEDGYLHHYHSQNQKFLFRRPVYNRSHEMFTTQVENIEIEFQRMKDSIRNLN